MKGLNEKDLVRRIHQNDTIAENEFVSTYYSKIRMAVIMRINDREDQKELINDILIAALMNLRNNNFDFERESELSKSPSEITRTTSTAI